MPTGLFGKLPSQGDFVTRRLPWEFTSVWDAWLQAGIARARADLGDAWNTTYLTAPLWRFQLAAGVVGANPWIGIWFASVDRVGRQFPLAIVETMPSGWAGRYAVIEHDEAFFSVEDVALQGLDPRLGFDAFDRSIEALGLEQAARQASVLAPQEIVLEPAELSLEHFGARTLRLAADVDAHTALAAAQSAGPATSSCFFTWGNEHHPPMLLRLDGLPGETEFHGFLDGRWS